MKKLTKQYIKRGIVFITMIVLISLAVFYYLNYENKKFREKFSLASGFTIEEVSFLQEQGYIDKKAINNDNISEVRLKSLNIIEQNLQSDDENFEVLATKLDIAHNTYKIAFKLENKSNKDKDFYLIPVSESNQTEFKHIKGVVKNGKAKWGQQGDWGYDIDKHKQDLMPELAQAYDDIDNNEYKGKPIKLTLTPKTSLTAQAQWGLSPVALAKGGLHPVYFLIQGSAGGAKEELTILNVHSHPQAGDNWTVSFTAKGTADLTITPQDQATIDDDEFVSLSCDDEERTPQILEDDVIFYPDWQCSGKGKVVHYTKKAGRHTLKFQFGGQIAYAHNSANDIKISGAIMQGVTVGASPAPSWSCEDTLTDSRDSKTYATVLIGSQCWMAENINVGSLTAGTNEQGTDCPSASEIEKYCYSDQESNCTIYGGLYQWNQTMCGSTTAGAQGLCPDNWHIPTHDEFTTLERAVCTSGTCVTDFPYDIITTGWRGTDEGTKLKSGGSSGFNGLRAGFRTTGGSFSYLSSFGLFWSSLQSGSTAWRRCLFSGVATVYRNPYGKAYGFSVRCLKD